jgi:methionyl-tRNA formyltransferase
MRIIFMGSPDFAVPSLENLVKKGHEVVAVYSQPPRKSGRGQKITPTAVHKAAEALAIPVETPEKLNADAQEILKQYKPDLICVAAYGLILPEGVLNIAPCINVHPSALPRWRGAAPMNYPILAGDTTTDVCIMHMEKGLDCGDVYLRKAYNISEDETAGELMERLTNEGATALEEVVKNWDTYKTAGIQQVGETTYAHKFRPADLADIRKLDFNKSPSELHNQVRGLSPWPGAVCTHGDNELKVLKSTNPRITKTNEPIGTIISSNENGLTVACAGGNITFTTLQRAGKKEMPVSEVLKGYPMNIGEIIA